MAFFDFMTKSRCDPKIEKAAPITEMTSEDYCKISREYKKKAIDAMRIDFETRVKEKKFCVGDYVTINSKDLPDIIQCFAIHKNPLDYDEVTIKLDKIVIFDGVRFGKVDYATHRDWCGEDESITHIVYLPMSVLNAKWENNKPRKC